MNNRTAFLCLGSIALLLACSSDETSMIPVSTDGAVEVRPHASVTMTRAADLDYSTTHGCLTMDRPADRLHPDPVCGRRYVHGRSHPRPGRAQSPCAYHYDGSSAE